MSKSRSIERILAQSEEKEEKYDWLAAEEFYKKVLRLVIKSEDFWKAGEIQERIGYCFYRGAFQAETQGEFKSRMLEAAKAYEEAAELYEKVGHAKSLYCKARVLFVNSWIHVDASQKKLVLDDCRKLMKKAIKGFEDTEDHLGYGKACNDLLFCLYYISNLEWDWNKNKRHLEEALKYGQHAISALPNIDDKREVIRAYFIVGLHSALAGLGFLSEEKKEEFSQKALSYAEKALELSKQTGDAYLTAWSNLLTEETQFSVAGNLELSLKHAREGLKQAKKTKDNYLIGYAEGNMSDVIFWKMAAEENPDKKRELCERTVRHAEDAVRHYLLTCHYDYLPAAYSLCIESYYFLARDVETDPKEKRSLLERAIAVGKKGLEYAKQSGMPSVFNVHHSLSKTLHSLSEIETQITEKRRLLEEALEHRQRSISILEQTQAPSRYWNRGVFQNYAALIKAELATVEMDKEKKRGLLEEAVSHMEECIELCTKWTTIYPQVHLFAALGQYYDWFGEILIQLYSFTKKEETLEKAIEVYEGTAEVYRKAELPSRVAEAFWHVAGLYTQLGEHTKAERNFQSAAENYRLAAERIPQLKQFYTEQALYMQAWSEIGKARRHHAKNHYGWAKEHYEKAADLHKLTERWNYLSLNYLAWARLEEAEDTSRREQTEEAKALFQQAAELFAETKKSIQARLEKIESKDEKEMLVNLAKASDTRREYCLGRIALEEAKILDRRGDHAASSRKYGSATEKFQKAIDATEVESDRQELRPIVFLCRAWLMMARAEAESSPDFYNEASKLFEEAKDHSLNEKAKLLALGHSSFCKALEAGTRFEATRDTTLLTAANQHLEGAAGYYLKAIETKGTMARAHAQTALEHAKATQRLFDAYVYMDKAKKETDPEKKARYYMMTERVLQTSAGLYLKAKHPEKSEQVQRLLEKVREERELAAALSEVLHAPTIASTTASFVTPTPGEERAVGLERFEHADIQASLILRVKEVKVGDEIDLEIEMVNTGKAPALLIKVEEIIPEDFKIKRAPEIYRVEDHYLNMKGKRLDPLKTVEIKIVVKPLSKGTFTMKPRILYIDENGKYKSHEPEPITVTVKELGISGWLKGPSK